MNTESVIFGGNINNLHEPYLIGDTDSQYISGCKASSGAIQSEEAKKVSTGETYRGKYAVYYRSGDEVVASNEDRFYVEWAGFLYWSNATGVLKRYNGTTTNSLGGHTAPATAPTVATSGAGLLTGAYIYTITYLHEDVFESAPTSIVAIAASANRVTLTYTDTPPSTATHRLIYRAGGLNPTLNLLAKTEVVDTTYADNTSDFNISRRELTTEMNDAPPSNLDMLVELHGTLFGAVDNKVYFSKSGQPEYWSNYQYVEFPTSVTGLGVVGSTVIAFTDSNMYMITGTSMSDMSLTKLPYQYGCKHKRTVQNIKGNLVWMSTMDEYDVLCMYSGGAVQILNITNVKANTADIGASTYADYSTETYDNFTYGIVNSVVADRKYYLFLTGRTVVVDFESDIKTYYLEDSIEGAYTKSNQLYVIEESTVYDYVHVDSPSYRDINILTREFTDGKITREKTYRKLHVNGEGTWSIKVTVDDKIVFTMDSADGDWTHLPSGIHGKRISFNIVSTGFAKIRGLSYEYELKKV